MLLYLAGQCAYFSTHIPPLDQWNSDGFSPSSCGRILSLPEFQFQDLSPLAFPAGSPEKESVVFEPPLRDFFLDGHWRSNPRPRPKTFKFLGVAGGTIERSCYSPHYVNTERDYERDYQATLPQGRTAADGCKPRHGRDDRKRERSFSGLRGTPSLREVRAEGWSELSPRCVGAAARRAGLSPLHL